MSFQIEKVSHGSVHYNDNMLLVDCSHHGDERIFTLGINESNINLIDSATIGIWKIKKTEKEKV